MPHANLIAGQYVDDENHQIAGPEFDTPSSRPQTFKEAIAQLAHQRDYVPPGWRPLFDDTLVKLQCVRCDRRNGIEFSEIAFGRGEMVIAAFGGGHGNDHGTDRVVQGILNRLRHASSATCACCGTRVGVTYRKDCFSTLCDRCHVHEQVEQLVDNLFGGDPAYSQAPLVEWDALPPNVQVLIPHDQIKIAHLKSLGVRIKYVEPQALQALQPKLKLLKQAVAAVRGR